MVSSSSAAKKHIYDLFIFSLKPRIDSQSLGENYFANKYKSNLNVVGPRISKSNKQAEILSRYNNLWYIQGTDLIRLSNSNTFIMIMRFELINLCM